MHGTGFFKGVGKGVVGAIAQPLSGGLDFASSAFEGIDATKDQLIGRPRAGTANRRLRLPRAIGGDGKVTAFLGSDGTEKEVRARARQKPRLMYLPSQRYDACRAHMLCRQSTYTLTSYLLLLLQSSA